LTDLSIVASASGDAARAAAYCAEGLALFRDLGDRWGMARALHNHGRLAAAAGDHERAARLYVASAALREAIGAPPRFPDRPQDQQDRAAAEAQLGPVAFALARATGQTMSTGAAVDYALVRPDPATPAASPEPARTPRPVAPTPAGQSTALSRRELEV